MDYSPWGHKVSDTTIKQHYFWLFLDAGETYGKWEVKDWEGVVNVE